MDRNSYPKNSRFSWRKTEYDISSLRRITLRPTERRKEQYVFQVGNEEHGKWSWNSESETCNILTSVAHDTSHDYKDDTRRTISQPKTPHTTECCKASKDGSYSETVVTRWEEGTWIWDQWQSHCARLPWKFLGSKEGLRVNWDLLLTVWILVVWCGSETLIKFVLVCFVWIRQFRTSET
jgi:hypothetical protein